MTNGYHTNRVNLLFGLSNNTREIESVLLNETPMFGVRTWDNVIIKNKHSIKNEKRIGLSGTTFLIQCHQQYYHFLIDCLGVYLYLKKTYPEVQPLVLFQSRSQQESFPFNDILDYLEINNRYVVNNIKENDEDYNVFDLEKLIYLYSNPYNLFKSEEIVLTLRDALHDKKELDKNKKIYISRRDTSRATIVNEEAIEKYFEDLGFLAVTLTGMSVLEQKRLFEDASVVVGRSGTSFTNMFFINKDTKIIDISTDIEFHNYDFRTVAKLLELDYTNIIIENFRDGPHLLQKLKEFGTIIQ